MHARSRFKDKAYRRSWFLRRMQRSNGGPGSDVSALMSLPRLELSVALSDYFADITYAIVGGVATRAYQPERATKDIDILVSRADLERVRARFQGSGGRRIVQLAIGESVLALEGEAWQLPSDGEIDLLWSDDPWASAALTDIRRDQTGAPVVALAFLVLMKIDASRSVDQGDLARMLGLADDASLDETRMIVRRYLGYDVANDLESYIELGRLEMGR